MDPILKYFGPAGDDATPRPLATQTGTSCSANFGQIVPVNSSAGAYTVNLPKADRVGEIAVRFAAGTNVITLDPLGTDTIDGLSSSTMVIPGESRIIASDGLGHWTTVASAPLDSAISAYVASLVTPLMGAYMPLVANVNTVTSAGSAYTIPDVDDYQGHDITLTANCAFTFPTDPRGKWFRMVIRQDAVGGWVITWPSNVRFPIGAFNLTTSANATDSVLCFAVRATHWGCVLEGKNYA